ncbi:MAG: hypothetical protein A3F09_01990 [Chlamydiae bacterium RIFCSPHIGHO2_12_FULL_49_11]|nr:MAG: hypothetical protein A3F09_01990 [Chlamydiae bacterium RIFCSPHIGHO2_12_FULL_49_11]
MIHSYYAFSLNEHNIPVWGTHEVKPPHTKTEGLACDTFQKVSQYFSNPFYCLKWSDIHAAMGTIQEIRHGFGNRVQATILSRHFFCLPGIVFRWVKTMIAYHSALSVLKKLSISHPAAPKQDIDYVEKYLKYLRGLDKGTYQEVNKPGQPDSGNRFLNWLKRNQVPLDGNTAAEFVHAIQQKSGMEMTNLWNILPSTVWGLRLFRLLDKERNWMSYNLSAYQNAFAMYLYHLNNVIEHKHPDNSRAWLQYFVFEMIGLETTSKWALTMFNNYENRFKIPVYLGFIRENNVPIPFQEEFLKLVQNALQGEPLREYERARFQEAKKFLTETV